jgi:V/A-type H+-transporting ATPase subunit I
MNIEMVPLQIIGLKNDLQQTLRVLQTLGTLHLEDIETLPGLIARPIKQGQEMLQRREEITLLDNRIQGILQVLKFRPSEKPVYLQPGYIEQAQQSIEKILPQIQTLNQRKEKLEMELSSLPLYESTLKKLLPLVPAAVHEPGMTMVSMLVNRAHVEVLGLISQKLVEISEGTASLVSSDIDASTHAMLAVFPEKYLSEIEALLAQRDVSRLNWPEELGQGPPDTLLVKLQSRLRSIPFELKEIDQAFMNVGETWGNQMVAWHKAFQDELCLYEAASQLGETEKTFIIAGWIPRVKFQELQTSLHEEIGSAVHIEPLEVTPELKQNAPVALQNPSYVKPFESLVKILSLPRYGKTDPSRLMAVFLPMFFGMMLGDIGYGAILLVLCVLLLRRFREGMMRDLLIVLAMGAGWAFVFGFLFGELFGTLGEAIGLHALWFPRDSSQYVGSLLIITIMIGAGHITLGLILGTISAWIEKSRSHLLERGGMLVGLIGLFSLTAVLLDYLPQKMMTPSIGVLLLGIAILGSSLGWLGVIMGPIEFIGLIGNILSYLRIAAIGLASVYLAKVANNAAGAVGSVVVGIIIVVLVHALNLALGVFSPTIHSLRLHYVEFFRKFYEGGGKPYQPFNRNKDLVINRH